MIDKLRMERQEAPVTDTSKSSTYETRNREFFMRSRQRYTNERDPTPTNNQRYSPPSTRVVLSTRNETNAGQKAPPPTTTTHLKVLEQLYGGSAEGGGSAYPPNSPQSRNGGQLNSDSFCETLYQQQ